MFARGPIYLHTPPLRVPKSPAAKSCVSATSKPIQTKRLQVHYSGHLRKTGGREGYEYLTNDVYPEPAVGFFPDSYSSIPAAHIDPPPHALHSSLPGTPFLAPHAKRARKSFPYVSYEKTGGRGYWSYQSPSVLAASRRTNRGLLNWCGLQHRRAAHGLPQLALREQAQLPGTPSFGAASLPSDPRSVCQSRPGGLRLGGFLGQLHRQRHRPGDHLFSGDPGKRQLRHQQHAEVGGNGRDKHQDYAGDLHRQLPKRFHQRQPNGHHDLHADRDQCHRLLHLRRHRDGHRNSAEQANDQLLHGHSRKHQFRFQQHADVGNQRRSHHRHHTGNLHLHTGKRFHQRQPNNNDNLHADSNQQRWLNHLHRQSYGDVLRWPAGYHHHFVPRRNTRRGLRGLHHRRQRRRSALHLFRKRKSQLPFAAGRNVPRSSNGNHLERPDRRRRQLHARICRERFHQRAGHARHQLRHQRQQRVPCKHFPVHFHFSPSRGRSHHPLARGFFPRRPDVQRLSGRHGEAFLRQQLEWRLSEWDTGHSSSLQPGQRFGKHHLVSILFHLRPDSRLRPGRRHLAIHGGPSRLGLSAGRRRKQTRAL